jgi:PAS domain S-box-containing protein
MRDAVVVTDVHGIITFWNEGATRLFGWTADEQLGRTLTAHHPTGAHGEVHDVLSQAVAGIEWEGEREDVRKDGSRVWVDLRVRPLRDDRGSVIGILGIAQDITARKEAERESRIAAERLRLALHAAEAGVWDWDTSGDDVIWSPENYRLHGIEEGRAVTFDVWATALHPDDLPRVTQVIDDTLTGKTAEYRAEYRVRHPIRGLRWVLGIGRVQRDADGQARRLFGINLDITDRKAGEQALQTSEARLRVALEAAGAIAFSWEVGSDEVIRYFSVEPVLPVTAHPERVADVRDRVHPDDREVFDAGIRACLEGDGTEYHSLYRVIRPDGSTAWLEEAGRLERATDGSPVQLTGVSVDVTERRRVEDAMRWNNRVLEQIARGTALDEVLDEIVRHVEEQLPGSICSILQVVDGKLHLLSAPGLPGPYNAAVEGVPVGPMGGGCGSAAFLARTVISLDIATDEHWRAYRDVALGHGLRSCLSVPIMASGNVPGIEVGRVLGTFAVYRREPGPPDPHAFAIVTGALALDATVEAARPSTHELAVAGAAHLARAALERVLAQDALKASEARFRDVLDASPAVVYLKDLDGRLLFVNRQFAEVFGIPQEQWVGRTARELLPAEMAERFETSERDVFETLRPRQVEEFVRRPDGTQGTFLSLMFPLFQDNGEPYALCGIATDVTDRRAAQEQRDYVWNNSPDPVCIAGFDGYLHVVNPAWTERLGWTAEELRSKPWIDFVHPDDREMTVANGERTLRGESLTGFVNRYRTRDGGYRWFLWNSISLPERQQIYGFIRDVTEQRRLEEQVRQAQKMEAIVQLAGGVAHDFNNLLTIINGYTALLLGDAATPSTQKEPLGAIRDAGDRAAALTAQLLAFSRKAIVEPKILDLANAVEGSVRLLRRLIGEDIRLETSFAPDLPRVRIDPGQLEQVLMNLVVNARDAMPTGGLLRVTATETLVPPGSAEPSDVPAGTYVRLSVTDSGVGMSDAVKSHIFEPFFTTKGVGKGTGLGLATVYGIVRQAGGTIVVDSALGRGTSFHVLLPAQSMAAADQAAVAVAHVPHGSETILLVEDEEAVRRFARFALEMHGYVVHEVGLARQALTLDVAALAHVSLLVTDVVMPGMGGRQLADQLRQRHPGMRVLYMSGYTDDAVVRHGLETSTDAFIQKPFTPQGLARKVREVLDAH